ncbi:MAG: hypothetical protein AKCLJLPJ_01109 [Fimbriimonadales bacterium]|nr:hypothetical protein [Fimbriimonadales bacterium]
MRSLTSLVTLVLLGVLVLVFFHSPVRGEDVVVLSGRVQGDAPEGKFPVGFHFFDKEKRALVHRAIGELEVRSGKYTASLPQGPLRDGGEYCVIATSPEVELDSYQGQPAEAWGLVRLQPSTPGIPQTGHVNITGTLVAGAIKTNALDVESGTRTFAIYGLNTATSGTMYGVLGHSNSTSGTGVLGWAPATTGSTYGVWGQNASTSGAGVLGRAPATSGITYGVSGDSSSTSGYGVFGWAMAPSGFTYGVYGRSDSPSGYGVYSDGDFAASGTKSFQIDHPLWPETHYLNHFCTEAPEPMNAYSGNVVTDARGYATVPLPDYFDSINRDFRYQLTVIDDSDDFVLAKVVREIRNNEFAIRTNKPRVKVSWRVEAVRDDLYIRKHGFETEQEKEDRIKGKYLQPELFGLPKEYGIHYSPDLEEMKRPGVRDLKPSPNNKGPKTTKSPKAR